MTLYLHTCIYAHIHVYIYMHVSVGHVCISYVVALHVCTYVSASPVSTGSFESVLYRRGSDRRNECNNIFEK